MGTWTPVVGNRNDAMFDRVFVVLPSPALKIASRPHVDTPAATFNANKHIGLHGQPKVQNGRQDVSVIIILICVVVVVR